MTKTDFDTKMSSLNRKIISKKSKHLHVENELRKLKTFDSIYYRGKIYCEKDGTQNYLVFQAVNKYFKVIAGTIYVSSWKSRKLLDEILQFQHDHRPNQKLVISVLKQE